MSLDKTDRSKVISGFFSFRFFRALKEIVIESLLHRRIFQRNRLLGFMHMSLAFGWFLLIAIGNLESRVYEPAGMNPPYVPIFFKFFMPIPEHFRCTGFFICHGLAVAFGTWRSSPGIC